MADTKTLLEIIKCDLAASGHRGPITCELIERWAEANPAYCRKDGTLWPLWVRYHSGSTLPMLGETTMDRIMQAWCAAGHPTPGKPGFAWAAFEVFADGYTDEYLELEGRERELIALVTEGGAIRAIRR